MESAPFIPIEILREYKKKMDSHYLKIHSNFRQMETDFVKELEKISVGTIRDMYIYLEKVVNDHNLMPKVP